MTSNFIYIYKKCDNLDRVKTIEWYNYFDAIEVIFLN